MKIESYGFDKKDRSSFSYWFAHWCAFQMVALNCHHWKFKYLFHDWYKPWLKLFMSYDKLQMFHNKHSKHHMLYWFLSANNKEVDWEQMILDWECSRFTKQASPLTAEKEKERIIKGLREYNMDNKTVKQLYQLELIPFKGTPEEKLYEYKIDIADIRLREALKHLSLKTEVKAE